jgi:hypothetical protein
MVSSWKAESPNGPPTIRNIKILSFLCGIAEILYKVQYKQYDSKVGGGVWSIYLENIIVFALENFKMLYIALKLLIS